MDPAAWGMGEFAHTTGRIIEAAGIAVMVGGGLAATVDFVRQAKRGFDAAYPRYRKHLGWAILLGLEFLVAADIIGTVAVQPSLANLAVLGSIVLIRTFLSFAIELEINGRCCKSAAARAGRCHRCDQQCRILERG